MSYQIITEKQFRYVDVGTGPVLFLLHGLFGALSNFKEVIDHFKTRCRVVIPLLPLFDLEVKDSTIEGLLAHVNEFIEHKQLTKLNLLGNSLGGHIALLYALEHNENIETLTLTGSSGLYESAIGDSYPKKGDYEFVKAKTEYTFYDPKVATKELIDEVFEIVNNREKAIRILYIARSAIRHNLKDELANIKQPVNLIWGKDDRITPLFAGEEFQRLLPNAELHIIDQCGHAAMMEKPEAFNSYMDAFLSKHCF
jgi:2-hydroxy-6-oxonona-2,4-dienedioate hydrolase